MLTYRRFREHVALILGGPTPDHLQPMIYDMWAEAETPYGAATRIRRLHI